MPTAPLVALTTAIVLPVLLAYTGGAASLGAHPWWSLSIALIGTPMGLVLAFLAVKARIGRWFAIAGSLLLLLAAGLAAHFGKMEFVASYAENGLAGRFWYYGWIGVMAALSLLLAVAFLPGKAK